MTDYPSHTCRISYWTPTLTVAAEAEGLRYQTSKGQAGLLRYEDAQLVRLFKSMPPRSSGFEMRIYPRRGRKLHLGSAHFLGLGPRYEDRMASYREFFGAAIKQMTAQDTIRFETGEGWAAYLLVAVCVLGAAGVLVWNLFLWEPTLERSKWIRRGSILITTISLLWALMYLLVNKPRAFDPRQGFPRGVTPPEPDKK